MSGGQGNDSYWVDNVGDRVIELSGEGTDTVWAGLGHTLSANVERLTLTGVAAIDGSGNELANVLSGNSAANRLDGGGGDDTLVGNSGADTLTGGTGADCFKFVTRTAGTDSLTDFTSGQDKILVVSANFGSLPVGELDPSRWITPGTPLTSNAARIPLRRCHWCTRLRPRRQRGDGGGADRHPHRLQVPGRRRSPGGRCLTPQDLGANADLPWRG